MAVDPYRYPLPTRSPHPLEIQRSLDERLGWLQASRSRGEQWLAAQRSTIDPNVALDVIAGLDADSVPDDQMSDVRSGEVGRDLLEMVAELANMRAEGQVRTDNADVFDQSAILDQRYKAWFTMIRAKRKVRASIAYAAVLGTGGATLKYEPDYFGPGRGENNIRGIGPHMMLPDGLPPDGNFQQAYGVHLIEEVPIHTARRRYPLLAQQIQPDRGMPSGWAKRMASFERWLSPVFNYFGVRGDKAADNGSNFPTVDIVETYIYDDSVNNTPETITTGKAGTSWEVQVPPMGSDIPTGINDEQGHPLTRKATRDDAMLYPNRRRIVWCNTCLIDDDNSPWWHGKVPLARFKIIDWPWEPNGISPMKGVVCQQRSQTRIMRSIENSILARLNPGFFYDESLMSDSAAEVINPAIPGQRVKANLQMGGEIIKLIVPIEVYEVPAVGPDWVKFLGDLIKRALFVQDVNALTKGRQLPGGDALDKMIELAGPVVRDILESIEDSMGELGEMLIYNFFQFDSAARRMEILGEDGVTKADFDYDPGVLVPSHLPGEDPEKPSRLTRLERAKRHAQKFYFYVTPGSLHDLSRTTMKLMVLQAIKAGLKLDQWTIAQIFGIPYYGPKPKGTQTVIERVIAERRIEMEMQAEAQAQAAAKLQAVQGQAGAGETGPGAGRPPTNAEPPQLQQKDQGTRTTVATSR